VVLLRRQVRRPAVDCFDIEARSRGKGSRDDVELMLRDHVFDAGKPVRRSLFGELHRGLDEYRGQVLPCLPISEVAARLIEVRSMGHSGLDLLTLSSSHFDPNADVGMTRSSR
jgi:hypothetical protein